jgi:crotonobetainyl-CoA:carnitine CoA-transferase CaiB-like acyl-CoA transferase
MATADFLAGITVAVDQKSRPLRIAARWLVDLGAAAYATEGPGESPRDDEWLGSLPPLPYVRAVDVHLIRPGGPTGETQARVAVGVTGSGGTALAGALALSEPEACAVGGLAVAVGEPERPPLPLPAGALDSLVGAHVAAAAVAALVDGCRETMVAAVDVAAWLVGTNIKMYEPYGAPWHRDGRRASGSGGCYPYGLFEASDGLFCLIGRTPEHWQALVRMVGSRELAAHPQLQDPRRIARTCATDADAFVEPWVARHTRHQLTQLLIENKFAGGPVYTCADVLGLSSLAGRWRTLSTAATRAPAPPFTLVEGVGTAEDTQLAGLRVLDLAWVWSGPAVSVALGDLGADVVKVESASRPDNTRLRGPSVVRPPGADVPVLEATEYFHATNRGKQSIALDLKTDEGRRVLRALADQADVIVENLSAGVMERWGVSPRVVLETNPTCTYISMRGFGDRSPLRDLRAYAPVLTSAAGLEDLVRYDDGAVIGMMTVGFSDALAASQALLLALAGVHSARNRGRGAAIVLSQFEAAVTANGRNLVDEQHGGAVPPAPLTDGATAAVGETLAGSPWVSRGLFSTVASRWLGELEVCGLPWRRDGSFPRVRGAAPELGEHTHQVLSAWLDMSEPRVDRLVASGASR